MGMNINYLSRKIYSLEARLEVNQELCAFSKERTDHYRKIAETLKAEGEETKSADNKDQVIKAFSMVNEFSTANIQLLKEQTELLRELMRTQKEVSKYLKAHQ